MLTLPEAEVDDGPAEAADFEDVCEGVADLEVAVAVDDAEEGDEDEAPETNAAIGGPGKV